jgi:hypothetical protein
LPRTPCPVFRGLAELMRPPASVVAVRGKVDVLFR